MRQTLCGVYAFNPVILTTFAYGMQKSSHKYALILGFDFLTPGVEAGHDELDGSAR